MSYLELLRAKSLQQEDRDCVFERVTAVIKNIKQWLKAVTEIFEFLPTFFFQKHKIFDTGMAVLPLNLTDRDYYRFIPLIDQFLAVLMCLEVGLVIHDIADRFLILTSTFSNIFVT
ncbi:hypothetical protein KUTeg_015132 [Tegillarca granosa]|uniref:Uncharacterized protein n=1 Tax=Tegillarca granosa TaxID=220873 RepID=A0ABQ9EUR4_TEGGR|nr:hypothetical protein KUTeg_015132 [Tegillarca granosa]